jgi:DeoR/GlpR family transcriptional regulator of sugar metabolism
MEGTATIEDLAETFGVSTATVRRDLKEILQQKSVVQTIGGGVIYRGGTAPTGSDASGIPFLDEKLRIAEYCTELVEEHDEIIVGPGTTTFLAGKILSGITDKEFRIITNSLEIALETGSVANISTVILGGVLADKHSIGFKGHAEYFDTCHKHHKLLLSADGISFDQGVALFHNRYLDIVTKMLDVSHYVVLAADSSKIGRTCFLRLCPLERIDKLVTDRGASEEFREFARKKKVEVIIV